MALHLDIDHFASVNENMSFEVGDQALAEMGRRLHALLQGRGHVWHHGSDEFVAVVPLQPGMPAPEELAEELLVEAEAPLSVLPYTLFLSTKAGVAICPQHATDADGLLHLAVIAAGP